MGHLSLYELDQKKLNATKEAADALGINAATVNGFTIGRNVGASDVFLTSTEKTKLTGIQSGAEVNQNAFSKIKVGSNLINSTIKTDTLTITNGEGISLSINNDKKELTITGINLYDHPVTHPASMIDQDSSRRFVTDTEKELWNSKASGSHIHQNIMYTDSRSSNILPNAMKDGISCHIKSNNIDGLNDGGTYHAVVSIKQWSNNSGGAYHELGFTDNGGIYHRYGINDSWNQYAKVYTTRQKPTPLELNAADRVHKHYVISSNKPDESTGPDMWYKLLN